MAVELNHQNAPLGVREKVSLNKAQVTQALHDLNKTIKEVFILSTCNRLSIYANTKDTQPIINFFQTFGNIKNYLKIYNGSIAVNHFFSTAAGLESQAVGEHQILGQIREAYLKAQKNKSIGCTLHELIKRAIHTGKRVRGETSIGRHPVSIASAAYDLINQKHDITKSRVLVIGSGAMAHSCLKFFKKKDPLELYVSSRSHQRAKQVAKIFQVAPITFETLKDVVHRAEIIIGATSTKKYLLGLQDMNTMTDSRTKMIIDFGMPRNFDPEIGQVSYIELYDLDDIKKQTDKGLSRRQEEIPKAQNIINEEVGGFEKWYEERKAVPAISLLKNQLETIRKDELKWALPKMGNLDDRQLQLIEKLTYRIINKISVNPIQKAKQYALNGKEKLKPIDTFKEIFNIKAIPG